MPGKRFQTFEGLTYERHTNNDLQGVARHYCQYRCDSNPFGRRRSVVLLSVRFLRKRKELETFLKQAGDADRKLGKQGAYGFLHLTTKVGLTESEILQASFKNSCIKRREKLDQEGFAEKILFQYNNDNPD